MVFTCHGIFLIPLESFLTWFPKGIAPRRWRWPSQLQTRSRSRILRAGPRCIPGPQASPYEIGHNDEKVRQGCEDHVCINTLFSPKYCSNTSPKPNTIKSCFHVLRGNHQKIAYSNHSVFSTLSRRVFPLCFHLGYLPHVATALALYNLDLKTTRISVSRIQPTTDTAGKDREMKGRAGVEEGARQLTAKIRISLVHVKKA